MPPAPADATRQRLLESAGPLFAAHGYRDTGVKQICDAAQCNVAAINYHFGSKQDFYAAVLAHAHRARFQGTPMPANAPAAPAATRFATWLRWWITALFDPRGPAWVQTLMVREMAQPTDALDAVVQRSIRPMYEHLCGLVRALLPAGAPTRTVRECANSVVGQIMLYKHSAPVIQRLGAMPADSPAGISRLADHVIAFSLAGIAARRRTGRRTLSPA